MDFSYADVFSKYQEIYEILPCEGLIIFRFLDLVPMKLQMVRLLKIG